MVRPEEMKIRKRRTPAAFGSPALLRIVPPLRRFVFTIYPESSVLVLRGGVSKKNAVRILPAQWMHGGVDQPGIRLRRMRVFDLT